MTAPHTVAGHTAGPYLLPCAHCGGKATQPYFGDGVKCADCSGSTNNSGTWNARSTADALVWLASHRRLSLAFHGPVYGDDDDQTEEWRVTREEGSINDREWIVVGKGDDPLSAILSARAALQESAR